MKKIKLNSGWSFWKDSNAQSKRMINLPHDAMIEEQRDPNTPNGSATGFYPGGKYYYEKTIFGAPEFSNSSVIIEFEGVYMKSRVWLNGEEIGGHIYGYTNFYIDLSEKLRIGSYNTLLVEADNSVIPNSRWYSGSGIYRDVNLYVGAKKHIKPDGIKVKTVSYSPAVIDIEIESTAQSESIVCLVYDGETEIASCNGSRTTLEIPKAKLWSADQPNLYRVEARVVENGEVIDSSSCKVGIRKIEWNAQNGLLINGKTEKLRGGCVHHDHGILGARFIEKAERRRLEKLKAMGFNAIRYSHNPTCRGFLDICDEIGLYVLEETFDQWKVPQSPNDYAIYFDSEWQKDIDALIHKDYSHPSVIMYCLGNEITDTGLPHGAAICKMLNDRVKSLDDTRPTTIAINGMLSVLAAKMAQAKAQPQEEKKQVGSAEVNDIVTLLPKIRASITAESLEALIGECVKCVDIVGYNYGENIYKGIHELLPERVILSSETFPKALGANWPMIETSPYVIGDFMWTCWDYLGEAGVGQPMYGVSQAPFSKSYPCQSADCGAFDLTGMPETFAYYTAIVWGKYDKPYIGVRPVNHSGEEYTFGNWRMTDTQHSWSWSGCEGKTAEVEVYSPGEKVELFFNEEKIGEQKLELCKCRFDVPYKKGKLEAIAYDASGKKIGSDMLFSAKDDECLTILPESTGIKADGEDIAYISIHITDSLGMRKMLSDKKITVTVEGAGELVAVGSAQPETTERFDSGVYTTYYGRMIAIIRSNGHKGAIRVTASAQGIPTASAVINAK